MKIKKTLNVITHDGKFHADELFAIALLKKFYCNIEDIQRTRNEDLIKKAINSDDFIVIDVGGVYDVQKMAFDHHQQSCQEFWDIPLNENIKNIPLSSTGLVFRFLLSNDLLQDLSDTDIEYIKKEYIMPIDAADNRLIDFEKAKVLMDFNKNFVTTEDENMQFKKALTIASILLDNLIENAKEHSVEVEHTKECLDEIIKIDYGKNQYNVVFVPKTKSFNKEKILSENVKIDFIVNEISDGLYNIRTDQEKEKYGKIKFKHKIPDDIIKSFHKDEMSNDWAGNGIIKFIHKAGFFSVVKGGFEDVLYFIKNILKYNYNLSVQEGHDIDNTQKSIKI